MNVLAEQTLEFICALMFAEEGIIDRDYWSGYVESIPEIFLQMTQGEREVLSNAARLRLKRVDNEEELAFCEAVASGDIYSQWC